MKPILQEMLTDESGKFSSTRAQSIWLMGLGTVSVLLGFVMIAYGIKDVTGYVSMVVAATFAKSASDVWASQAKSGRVKSAEIQAKPPMRPTQPDSTSPSPSTNDQKPGDAK